LSTRLAATGGLKDGHEPTTCTCSPEGQTSPGLHQKKHGQQVEGDDSVPLLHSGESPPGVLCPALKPSAQERHGLVRVGPEESHRKDQRDATSFL